MSPEQDPANGPVIEERILGSDGKLRCKTIKSDGEEKRIYFDDEERPVVEELYLRCQGKPDYTCRTEFSYERGAALKSKKSISSNGETRFVEFDQEGREILEHTELKRSDGSIYSSTMRMHYYKTGKLRQRFFEDSDGEKRRTEYDEAGRKKIEDLRFVSPGKSGYVARTEYAYTTEDVYFRAP